MTPSHSYVSFIMLTPREVVWDVQATWEELYTMLYPENDTSIYLRTLWESGIETRGRFVWREQHSAHAHNYPPIPLTLRAFLWCDRNGNAAESDIVPPVSSDKELCSFGQNGVSECGTVYCRQRWNIQIRSSILSSVLKNIFGRICIDNDIAVTWVWTVRVCPFMPWPVSFSVWCRHLYCFICILVPCRFGIFCNVHDVCSLSQWFLPFSTVHCTDPFFFFR